MKNPERCKTKHYTNAVRKMAQNANLSVFMALKNYTLRHFAVASKLAIIFCLCIAIAGSLYAILSTKASSRKQLPDISHITIHLEVDRLEQELFSSSSREAIHAFLERNKRFATQFLGLHATATEEQLTEQLYAMINDPDIRALYGEVQQVFGYISTIQQQLETAFRYLCYYYPDFTPPQVATFITGMYRDLYVSEDLIVIGLDFFMGERARVRPFELPQYILRAYQPAYIVPRVLLLLSRQFIKDDHTDLTLLADMIYYGKSCHFAQTLLPQVDASVILAYTPEQLLDVHQHRHIVWEHFVENELLYVINPLTKNKYVSDRPFVSEIGKRCPGNIGRWLGWEIIKSYLDRHPTTTLPLLMNHHCAQELFVQSGYRP